MWLAFIEVNRFRLTFCHLVVSILCESKGPIHTCWKPSSLQNHRRSFKTIDFYRMLITVLSQSCVNPKGPFTHAESHHACKLICFHWTLSDFYRFVTTVMCQSCVYQRANSHMLKVTKACKIIGNLNKLWATMQFLLFSCLSLLWILRADSHMLNASQIRQTHGNHWFLLKFGHCTVSLFVFWKCSS